MLLYCLVTADDAHGGARASEDDGSDGRWRCVVRSELRRRPRGTGTLGSSRSPTLKCSEDGVIVLIIVLLVLWLIATVIGFAFKGLLWLAVIGIILFLGTAAIGFVRRGAIRR
jgi:hypothetical protein